MRIALLLAVLSSAAISATASILTGTFCQINIPPSEPLLDSGTNSCLVERDADEPPIGQDQFTDRASAFVDIWQSGSGFVLQVDSETRSFEPLPTGKFALSRTEFDATFWMTTSGPPRPGQLTLVGGSIADQNGFAVSGQPFELNVWIDGQQVEPYGLLDLDFDLGEPFPVRIQGFTELSEGFRGTGPGVANIRFGFELWTRNEDGELEAGATPIPEPATVSLFAAGLAVLWFRRRR